MIYPSEMYTYNIHLKYKLRKTPNSRVEILLNPAHLFNIESNRKGKQPPKNIVFNHTPRYMNTHLPGKHSK